MVAEVAETARNDTEHDPRKRAQASRDSLPMPPADQVTLPLGKEPVTEAVHLTAEKTTADEEEHATVVTVLAGVRFDVALVPAADAGFENNRRDEPNRTRTTAIVPILLITSMSEDPSATHKVCYHFHQLEPIHRDPAAHRAAEMVGHRE